MKTPYLLLVCVLSLVTSAHAEPAPEPFGKTLFEDDFSGTELKEEWGSWKSETVVKDGVMVGITPTTADHPSVNQIKLPPLSDMEVAVKFKYAGSPRFNIMIRDLDYKGSHAGHICHVGVSPDSISLYDGKYGQFLKEIRDKRKAGIPLTEEEKKHQETKRVTNKLLLDKEAWHTLRVRIEGDVMKAWIDGELACQIQSEGIAHKTKSNMNITTMDREMHYDDFSIRVPE